MAKADSVVGNPLFTVLAFISLSLWTSLPLYLLKFGGLSGSQLLLVSDWEGVVLLVPLPGVVASVYGLVTGIRVRALFIGLVPYAPLVLLGYPLAVLFLIPGISNGLFGLASAILKGGERFVVKALIVFAVGVSPWLYLVTSLFRYG